jgi:hypothetical protein
MMLKAGKSGGTLVSSKSSSSASQQHSIHSIGSSLSGEQIIVSAGNDITARGATLVGSGDVELNAQGNAALGTGQAQTKERPHCSGRMVITPINVVLQPQYSPCSMRAKNATAMNAGLLRLLKAWAVEGGGGRRPVHSDSRLPGGSSPLQEKCLSRIVLRDLKRAAAL